MTFELSNTGYVWLDDFENFEDRRFMSKLAEIRVEAWLCDKGVHRIESPADHKNRFNLKNRKNGKYACHGVTVEEERPHRPMDMNLDDGSGDPLSIRKDIGLCLSGVTDITNSNGSLNPILSIIPTNRTTCGLLVEKRFKF